MSWYSPWLWVMSSEPPVRLQWHFCDISVHFSSFESLGHCKSCGVVHHTGFHIGVQWDTWHFSGRDGRRFLRMQRLKGDSWKRTLAETWAGHSHIHAASWERSKWPLVQTMLGGCLRESQLVAFRKSHGANGGAEIQGVSLVSFRMYLQSTNNK